MPADDNRSVDDVAKNSLVLEFLARLAADRSDGTVQELGIYLAQFPGADEEIGAAYRAARDDLPRPQAASPLTLGPGCRIGVYRIERLIGRGAQGRVFLAHDEHLGRAVALKVVPRSPFADDHAPRFRREAEFAASLDHPGLCTIYDMGRDDAIEWIALRHVPGRTLAERIREAAPGLLDCQEVIAIGEQAARALHVAHEAGIIHRDIKPSNLMVTPDGDVVILDFGIARHEAATDALTQTSQVPGTPAYMAPEAFRLTPSQLGRSIDVWGLGVTLYEALTGRRAFEGSTRETLVRSIEDTEPPRPSALRSEVGSDLDCVISTALAKESHRRYRTALELAEDLRRVRERRPILARPASAWVHLDRFCRRNPELAGALLALLIVLAVGMFTTAALLIDVKRTLKQKETALAEFSQLADQKVARDLIALERELWPATPERVADLERWLTRANDVIARRDQHVAILMREAASDESIDPRASERDSWLRDQLSQLLRDLDRLSEQVPAVSSRLELARTVRQTTIEDRVAEWSRAQAAVAADPRFRNADGTPRLRLEPQLGLIPLGPDPDSGLEEFAVLSTGAPPVRDPATGRITVTNDMALVLVLLPGGDVTLGAFTPSVDHPLGSPRVDPDALDYESPPLTVRLDPFLLSKFELTQGQWFRHTGERPSSYGIDSQLVAADSADRHPLETVDALRAERVLTQLGLELPTEAQWEYAARAGTDTIYSTGNSAASLQGFANLADRYAREHDGSPNWQYSEELNDGYTAHAPVGTFAANRFGLHEMIGNVNEICRDTWQDWKLVPPRDGDGESRGNEGVRACRGGDYGSGIGHARSASRLGIATKSATHSHGFRPSRRIH